MQHKSEVAICTHGSIQIGLGHLKRSCTIANLLTKHIRTNIFVAEGIECIESNKVDASINVFSDADQLKRDCLVVIDMDRSYGPLFLKNREWIKGFAALDWFDTTILPDKCWNLYDHTCKMMQSYREHGLGRNYSEGGKNAIIREDIKCLRKQSTSTPKKNMKPNIVITIGASDPYNRTISAVQDIKMYAQYISSLVIIVGPLTSKSVEKAIKGILLSEMKYELRKAPEDFCQILNASDVVLTNGGTTLLESMYLGKATVVYPQTNEEAAHARHHVQKGNCSFRQDLLKILKNQRLRVEMGTRAMTEVSGSGQDNIVKGILELAGSLT